MKRLLALIENNAQANALQRETTMNILLRIELIEQTVKLISAQSPVEALNRSVILANDYSKERISRNASAEKIAGGRDSTDYMAVIGRRKNTVSSPKRTPNRSPEPGEENFGKI